MRYYTASWEPTCSAHYQPAPCPLHLTLSRRTASWKACKEKGTDDQKNLGIGTQNEKARLMNSFSSPPMTSCALSSAYWVRAEAKLLPLPPYHLVTTTLSTSTTFITVTSISTLDLTGMLLLGNANTKVAEITSNRNKSRMCKMAISSIKRCFALNKFMQLHKCLMV